MARGFGVDPALVREMAAALTMAGHGIGDARADTTDVVAGMTGSAVGVACAETARAATAAMRAAGQRWHAMAGNADANTAAYETGDRRFTRTLDTAMPDR